MLRLATLMQWDDDDIVSFSNTQHAGNISLCRQAVQHVLNELVADYFFWDEDASGTFFTVATNRVHTLGSDFVKFRGTPCLFELEGVALSDATGTCIYEYPGGEDQIMRDIPDYTSRTGTPQWFYFTDDTTIGLYPIPDTSYVYYRFEYEKNVMVENESDTLPFDSNQKCFAFVDMATRLFTFLFTRQPLEGLGQDIIYKGAKKALLSLLKKSDPVRQYGYRYRS